MVIGSCAVKQQFLVFYKEIAGAKVANTAVVNLITLILNF